MVANISATKQGWETRLGEFSDWSDKGKAWHDELLRLIDEDTAAFNRIMSCFRLPKKTDEDKTARNQAIQDATKYAIDVPFHVMEVALESMQVIKAMAESGNPASVSDAGVGALCARTAVMGAFLNVKINSASLTDKKAVEDYLRQGRELELAAIALEQKILEIVNDTIETHET